jgi:tetratricopeptide (TPR) repeat protein
MLVAGDGDTCLLNTGRLPMKAFWTGRGLVALVTAILLCDFALAQQHPDDYRRSMGNLRPSHRTAVPAIQGSPPPRSSNRQRSGRSYVYRPYFPAYGYGYHGYPYGSGYYPYPSWYVPNYWRYGYSAPLVVRNGAQFGPVAGQRFLGADRPAVHQQVVVIRDADNNRDRAPAAAPANRRTAAARRFIGFGDAHFRNGKYSEALHRYKSAAKSSPTLGDAYFRQGYALMAMGRYEPAAGAIERGLELDPNWARSGFHNDDLYEHNAQIKAKHIDALATAAADAPDDGALQFLFGVCLYFDGRPDQAAPFFEHASRLIGDDAHVAGFLPRENE